MVKGKIDIPSPGVGKRGLDGRIAYLIRQANATVRIELDNVLSDFGMTLPQFSILTMIDAYPSPSGADIARLTFQTPQTVNLIVRNLEQRDILEKKPDEIHGRILRITITDHGRKLLAKARTAVGKKEKTLTEDLTEDEEMIIRKWLVRIAIKKI